jgi:hypothetical protein
MICIPHFDDRLIAEKQALIRPVIFPGPPGAAKCENDCATRRGFLPISIPIHPKVVFIVCRSVYMVPYPTGGVRIECLKRIGLATFSSCPLAAFCAAAGPGQELQEVADENRSL